MDIKGSPKPALIMTPIKKKSLKPVCKGGEGVCQGKEKVILVVKFSIP